jgi:hypothetical protein
MEKLMTKLALLSAGLVATAMLVGPVAAREHHNVQRHVAVGTDVSASPAPYYPNGPSYYPAPRVGAFATAPWDNGPPPYYAGPGYY